MAELFEGRPPHFTSEDSTLTDLKRDLENIGLLEGELYEESLQLLRDVLAKAEHHGIALSNLAFLTGTGSHPGMFWSYLCWLLQWGLLIKGDAAFADRFVLGPYGVSLLAGLRTYGCNADRWRAIPVDGF